MGVCGICRFRYWSKKALALPKYLPALLGSICTAHCKLKS